MIDDHREWSPDPGSNAQRFVHRMAYRGFPMPLPPEQWAPDSCINRVPILDGEKQYFDESHMLRDLRYEQGEAPTGPRA